MRPDAYIEISNFYTVTIYNKGAEVIRMLHTLLGEATFQAGMRIYFERHDGEAVTTGDFVAAMEAASGMDLGQFQRWYTQAGTPILSVRGTYDATHAQYVLDIEQRTPPTPGQLEKLPLHIPVRVALLGDDGTDLPLHCAEANLAGEHEAVLDVREPRHTFRFSNVPSPPVPSLCRERALRHPSRRSFDHLLDHGAPLLSRNQGEWRGLQLARDPRRDILGRKMGERLQLVRVPGRRPPAEAELVLAALLRGEDPVEPEESALGLCGVARHRVQNQVDDGRLRGPVRPVQEDELVGAPFLRHPAQDPQNVVLNVLLPAQTVAAVFPVEQLPPRQLGSEALDRLPAVVVEGVHEVLRRRTEVNLRIRRHQVEVFGERQDPADVREAVFCVLVDAIENVVDVSRHLGLPPAGASGPSARSMLPIGRNRVPGKTNPGRLIRDRAREFYRPW